MSAPGCRAPRGRVAERGAAIAELAIVAPVVLMLLLVVYDFGRAYVAFISVTNGARDAARLAMQDDRACDVDDLGSTAQDSASPYAIELQVVEDEDTGTCWVTVTHRYDPILPFVTDAFELPEIGRIGPLWDGTMSETMVSR